MTQRWHPTAERALSDGAWPDASISPQLACSLPMEDAARQRDAEDDTQVAKMMHGLSKRESRGFFHQEGFLSSFIAAQSTARSVLRTQLQLGRGLRYFTLSLQSNSQGMGRASQHSPAVPGKASSIPLTSRVLRYRRSRASWLLFPAFPLCRRPQRPSNAEGGGSGRTPHHLPCPQKVGFPPMGTSQAPCHGVVVPSERG